MAPGDPDGQILRVAAVLHSHGQSSDATLRACDDLAAALGTHATIDLQWGDVAIEDGSVRGGARRVRAQPASITMSRVVPVSAAVRALATGRVDRRGFDELIDAAEHAPPSRTVTFTLAAIVGACALALIFGASDPTTLLLVAIAAGTGAVARRALGRAGFSALPQAAVAALIAGLLGGAAEHLSLGTTSELVAVCPCMILVPGPHLINGGLDLLGSRLVLGLARLTNAALLLAAIGLGLLLGLAAWGETLTQATPSASVPSWIDIPAAAAAAWAYSIFYSTPARLMLIPITIGTAAHGVHWGVLHAGASTLLATALAALLAGILVAPLARKYHLVFPAVGFATVVAMLPGLYAFRAISAIIALTGSPSTSSAIADAATDGATALVLTVFLILGLVLPLLLADKLWKTRPVSV